MLEGPISGKSGQIPTTLRLLLVLEEIAKAGQPVLPSELGKSLGLAKPTIHRLLATAEDEGLLQRDLDGRSYGPGQRMRRLAVSTLSSQRIRTERLMVMRALAAEVGETCNLAAPGRHSMTYLDRVETHWPLRIQLPIGTKVPFHCTASGKMYLSSLRSDKLSRVLEWLNLERFTNSTLVDQSRLREELADTRARGYATDNEEFMEDMVAVAVPILDRQGRLLTTLSIHAPKQRNDLSHLVRQLPTLQQAAERLEEICND